MNFPSLPQWGKTIEAGGARAETFLGVVNEVVRENASASDYVSIKVSGLSKFPAGTYRLAYTQGDPLRSCLKKLKLLYAGMSNSVRDLSNLEHGRCRMSYVPAQGAVISIGPARMGVSSHLQRASVDTQELATNMGRKGSGPAPRIVEAKK